MAHFFSPMDLAMLFAAATAGFVTGAGLIIAIGAQNAFVLRQGLRRSHVALVVAVCALSDIALILCGVAGVGALVREWPGLLQALRFGGAAFIGWYGLQAAQRAWRGAGALVAGADQQRSWQRVLLACLAFTFLNPHVYLDTMVLLGSLSARYPGMAQWAFGLGACVASVVWFSALGFGARWLQPVFRKPLAWRLLDGGIAAFMLVLCLLLLFRPLA
jgi:L-lysine exporter family protein LysE/ArgO